MDRLIRAQVLPDVALLDEDTGVVDRLGKTKLVDTGLEAALQEIFDAQGQHVIELHTGLVEDTGSHETANQRVTLEKAAWVFLVECEKLTGCCQYLCRDCVLWMARSYRAARRILERVSMTRHTSRLLRRPYSPTIFNSESLGAHVRFKNHRHKQSKL